MKKTNNTRKIAAMIAAMALTATMVVPSAMMSASAASASIEITGISATEAHTFEVYQIFTGDLTDGTFTNLRWGTGISQYDSAAVASGELVPSDTIDAITALTGTDKEKANTIISKITPSSTKACDNVVSDSGTASITGLADGYYLIKDVTNLDGKDDANSAWIIQVAGTVTNLAIKNAKPSVDKQIHDEPADAETGHTDTGWGESADHAINESFQFKLTATIPADSDLTAYETYKLMFTDTMSAGVTFESIESVTVGGTAIATTAYTANKVGSSPAAAPANGDAGISWTLSIDDIIPLIPTGKTLGSDDIVVEVIYNAHLNENAIISTASGNDLEVNNNKVKLTYSNNPDNTGAGTSKTGETPEDFVWCFTYEVDNTKYKISADPGNELEGAGFTLYSDSAKTNAIKLIDNGDGTYTVADQNAASGTTVTEMTSHAGDGIFNIKGLDAGTYYLSETSVPSDYNAAEDIEIVITATHVENSGGTAANLSLSGSNVDNKIVDTKNSALPSTGGMGTTLFILGGGMTAAAAGIYLVSKKRAKEECAQ